MALSKQLTNTLTRYYLSDVPIDDIIESLELNESQINEFGYLIYGQDGTGRDRTCLLQKRKKQLSENPDAISVSNYRVVKSHIVDDTQARLIQKIVKKLNSIKEEDIENISDLKILTDIYAQFDKIGRLEKGEATENIDVSTAHSLTLRDINNGKQLVDVEDESDADYSPLIANQRNSNDN